MHREWGWKREEEREGESKSERTHLDRHWVMWLPGFLGDSSNAVHSDASSVERRAGQKRQLASGCVSELNKQVPRTLREVSYSIQTHLSFCSWWMCVLLNSVITVNACQLKLLLKVRTFILIYSNLCYQDTVSYLNQVMVRGAIYFSLNLWNMLVFI